MPEKELRVMAENESRSQGADLEASPPGVSDSSLPEGPGFKDRKIGLIAFGVVQLLMALGMVLMAAFQFMMVAGAERFAPPGSVPASKWTLLGGGFVFLALAVVAVVLGIGSIRCRRWARSLNLLLASLGLAMGVLASITLGFLMPRMMRTMESQMGATSAGFGFVIGCMAVVMVFMYLIVPAAFVVFYRSRHVKATCEFYDPEPRWTDRRPLPVLAGASMLLLGTASVVTPAMGLGVPLFGWIATGAAAWLIAGGFSLASAVLAWGFFHRRRWAWLGALANTVLGGANGLLMFRGGKFYEQMQLATDQLEMINEIGLTRVMTTMMAAMMLIWFGFYLWLGRYFKAGETLLDNPG